MATALKIDPLEDKDPNFISRTHKMLINGKWVDAASGKTFPTLQSGDWRGAGSRG